MLVNKNHILKTMIIKTFLRQILFELNAWSFTILSSIAFNSAVVANVESVCLN